MPISSNPTTPRQLEVDAVVDLLDKFYSDVWEEGGSIEYVSRTTPYLKLAQPQK